MKKKRGLRGLSGTPAEHERTARSYLAEVGRLAARARTCGDALRVVHEAGFGESEAGWSGNRELERIMRAAGASAKSKAHRLCGCKSKR